MIFLFVEIKTCICNRRNLLSVELLVKHVFVFKRHDDGTATKSLVLDGLRFCSPDYSGRLNAFLWAVNGLRGAMICGNTVLVLLLWTFFLQINRWNLFVQLPKNFFEYRDTEVRPEHWKNTFFNHLQFNGYQQHIRLVKCTDRVTIKNLFDYEVVFSKL